MNSEWTSSLFGCLRDPESCFCIFCVPFGFVGIHLYSAYQTSIYNDGILITIQNQLNRDYYSHQASNNPNVEKKFCAPCMIASFLCCIGCAYNRYIIRKNLKIKATCLNDLILCIIALYVLLHKNTESG